MKYGLRYLILIIINYSIPEQDVSVLDYLETAWAKLLRSAEKHESRLESVL